jgi:phage terminase small subunit
MSKKLAQPPADLSLRAQAIWRDYLKGQDGGISAGWLRLLERACRASDLLDLLEQQLTAAPLVVTTKTTGAEHVNPLVKLKLDVGAEFDRLARQLRLETYDG